MPVEVVGVRRLSPRMVSVLVGGGDLSAFESPAPASHVKVFLPVDGATEFVAPTRTAEGLVWPPGPRPVLRTYTPRRYVDGMVELQFVLHGPDGTAGPWAQAASVGERLALAGPGGRPLGDAASGRWWIGGDESALPAIATILESLQPGELADVHVEVDGPGDHLELPAGPGTSVSWHHRAPGVFGEELLAAATSAGPHDGDAVWVACEASAVRRIRRQLLTQPALLPTSVTTRGYWRLGTSNHPDHDFGED